MKIFVGSSIRGEGRIERDKTDDYFYKLGDEVQLRGAQLRLFGCITWDNRMREGGSQEALNKMIEDSDASVFMLAGDVGDYTREEIDIALDATIKSGKPKVYIFSKKVDCTPECEEKLKQVREACKGNAEFFEYGEFDEIKGRLRDVVRKDGGQVSMALQAIEGREKGAQSGFIRAFDENNKEDEVKTRNIYVFISSALNETARRKLCNEIHGMGHLLEDVFKVRIVPVTCDYAGDSVQDAIDKAVNKGDICCFVFDGEYKEEDSAEFDKACELMKNSVEARGDGGGNIKPRIYCFFTEGRCDEATEKMRNRIAGDFKHYYEEYADLARVQYRVIMSVIDLIGAACGMSENGLIYAGDKVLFSANFLPEFFNNEKLKRAEEEFFKARREYEELQFLHENTPSPGTDRRFAEAAENYKRAKEELEYLRTSIMNASLRLVHTADGEILPEEARAREKFLQGDLDGANKAINVKQIRNCARVENEENKRRNLAWIHALLFKVEIMENCTYESKEEQDKARRECYMAIKEIAEDGNVGCDGILAYLRYLLKYVSDMDAVLEECLEQADIFNGRRSYRDITDEYRADMHIVLGEVYAKKGDYIKARECIQEGIKSYKLLAKDKPEINNKTANSYLLLARIAEREGNLQNAANNYFNAGKYYQEQNNFMLCEESYKQAYEIYVRLAEKNPGVYEPNLAGTCNNLGNLYGRLNRHTEAEKYFKRAYEIRSRLAEKNPGVYESDLAGSCNNLGNLYRDLNRYTEAEEYHKRAYEIRSRLAEKNPEAYEQDLARTCNNLGAVYGRLNRYTEAEKYFKRAYEIRSRLAEKNPEAYESDLAGSCNNLGALYGRLNRYTEAEEYYKRTYEIYTRLTEKNPAAYESDLAMSCNNLGALYGRLNRYAEAEEYYKRAYEIYTRLAEKNPEAYESDLATSCNNLGALYSDLDRYTEAEEYHKRAYEIRRRLAEKNPEAYESDLAGTCNNLGALYSNLGRYTEAEEYHKRAYEIYKRLAEKNPEAYEPDLAKTCNNLGNLYRDLKRYTEAEEYYKRAYEIRSGLTEKNPEAYERYLAMSCNNLGVLYNDMKRYTEAEEYYKRAYEIYTRLAEKNLGVYEPDLAGTCNNLGTLSVCLNRYIEAEEYYKRAYEIYVRLAEKNSGVYESDLAMSCNNLGNLYSDLNRYTEAEEYYKQAYEIYTRLAEKNPEAYEQDLAGTCNNLGAVYCRLNRHTEAEKYFKRAYEIRSRLAEKNPEAYESDLAGSCNNLGVLYSDLNRYIEAEEYYKRAYEIRSRLAEKNPGVYESDLAGTCNNLGNLYGRLNRHTEAEEYYKRTYEIYDRLSKVNPVAYEPELADICILTACAIGMSGNIEEAKEYCHKAMTVVKRMKERGEDVEEREVQINEMLAMLDEEE